MSEKGIAPDVVTYNTLINQSPARNARAWFDRMQADGIAPNVVTYNTLINQSPASKTHTPGLTACRPTALHRTSSPTAP